MKPEFKIISKQKNEKGEEIDKIIELTTFTPQKRVLSLTELDNERENLIIKKKQILNELSEIETKINELTELNNLIKEVKE